MQHARGNATTDVTARQQFKDSDMTDLPHFDLDTLQELKQIMGSEFHTLLQSFASDSALRIRLIQDAVAAGDGDALRRAAHSFKGSSGNMGARQLAELCRQIEQFAHAGDVPAGAALVPQLIAEYAVVEREMAAL